MKHLVKFKHIHLNKVSKTNQLKATEVSDTSSEEITEENSKLKILDVAPALETFRDALPYLGDKIDIEPPKTSLPEENEKWELRDNL